MDSAGLRRAGSRGHRATATRANRQSRKQYWSGRNARRDDLWSARVKLTLNLFKIVFLDYSRNRRDHDFAGRLSFPGPGRDLVELPLTDVNCISQNFVEYAGSESCAGTAAITAAVKPFGQFLYTQRARRTIAIKIELENQPDCLRVHSINRQCFLDFRAALFNLDQAISERDGRAIPKALLSISTSYFEGHAWRSL